MLEVEGCYGRVCVERQQCRVIGKCKKAGGMMCGDIGFVWDIKNRRKDTSLGHSCVRREEKQER